MEEMNKEIRADKGASSSVKDYINRADKTMDKELRKGKIVDSGKIHLKPTDKLSERLDEDADVPHS